MAKSKAEYTTGRPARYAPVPWELQDWVQISDDREIDGLLIAVYAALKRFADFGKSTGARVSDAKASRLAGCSVRTFRRRRDKLRDEGWIDWTSSPGRSNLYVVHSTPRDDPGHTDRGAEIDPHEQRTLRGGSVTGAEVSEESPTSVPVAEVETKPRSERPRGSATVTDPPRSVWPTTNSQLPIASTEEDGAREYLTELRTYLGDRSDALDLIISTVRSKPEIWAMGILGSFGPDGSKKHLLRPVPENARAGVLADAMSDFGQNELEYNARYFDSYVRRAVEAWIPPGEVEAREIGAAAAREESKRLQRSAAEREREDLRRASEESARLDEAYRSLPEAERRAVDREVRDHVDGTGVPNPSDKMVQAFREAEMRKRLHGEVGDGA